MTRKKIEDLTRDEFVVVFKYHGIHVKETATAEELKEALIVLMEITDASLT
jgi:hypothetical protein